MTRSQQQQRRYDIDYVRQAARGRWPEIFWRLGGISQELLDGRHHPCPKCGGSDRFRMIDQEAGALLCNQCFGQANGDGFSALAWLTGRKFGEILASVADHLGIQPEKSGKSHKKQEQPNPSEHLEFEEWNELLVATWCLNKPPITPAAVRAVGGRIARYRGQHTVIAIPVWGPQLDRAEPVGWCLYNISGGVLPKYTTQAGGGYKTEFVKVKLTHGSQPGVMTDLTRFRNSTATAWKLEGPSDVLAFLSLPDLPQIAAPWTNANGAKERPADWMITAVAGRINHVVHDADKPGQDGALGWTDERGRVRLGWATAIAGAAASCRNVVLPYPISQDHGKDLRDFASDGRTYSDLSDLAELAPQIQADNNAQAVLAESDDDPHRLARVNLERYAQQNGGRTLRYWRDEWYVYRANAYRKITEKELRAKIAQACKEEFDRLFIEKQNAGDIEEGEHTTRKVTQGLVSNVILATAGMTVLSSSIEPMTWLPTRERKSYLVLQNGILDLDAVIENRDDYLLDHSPDWFSTVCLPYNFDPQAKCPKWEAFLERNLELDPERIKLLQEWAGYLLLPDTGMQRFLVLEGEGANGKSVYCAAIEAMLGSANVAHVPLEMFGEKFELTSTLDRLANICGDAGELDKVAEGHIKAFTAGNPMSFGRKYLDSVERVPTARLIMAVNNRPRFSDRSDGIWRRMLLVPWRIQIPVDQRVPNMDKPWWWEATGELPGILIWAIKGLARLRAQGQFTVSQLCDEVLADYRAEMNPARRFLSENLDHGDCRIKCGDLYRHYVNWSKENGHHPLAEQQFGKEVTRTFRKCERKRAGKNLGRTYFYEGLAYTTEKICGQDTDPGVLF